MANAVEVKFSKQELSAFVEKSDTCVTLERKKRVLYVNPGQFYNLSTGIHETLDLLLLKYDFLFKAIILGYNKIKLLSRYGSFCYRSSKVALQVEADFYLFNPAVGSKLQGVVCKRSGHHLGCLVHKAFNVFIPIKENDYMTGWDYSIGQEVIFTIDSLDLTSGPLPYIKGQLYTEESEGADGDGNGSLVGTDSGTSFGHEDEMGGWDSGVALSSPGKDTVESEDMEMDNERRNLMEFLGEVGMSSTKKKISKRKVGDEMIKELLKFTEMSSEEETEASKKNVLDGAVVLPSPERYYEPRSLAQEHTKEDLSSPKAAKIMKSILKNKKDSKNEETGEKSHFKDTDIYFSQEKTGVSEKFFDETLALSSPRKDAAESKEMEEDKSTSMDKEKMEKAKFVKRKSILKNKTEGTSPKNDEMKRLLNTTLKSLGEEETKISKKKDLEKTAAFNSPRKGAVESKVTKEEDESRHTVSEVNVEGLVPSKTVKKRKSTLKNKKEDPSLNSEEMIKALLKTMEMSFEEKAEVSLKEGAGSVEVVSPGKHAAKREATTDESRQMIPGTNVESSPKTVTKMRKSILKNKKESPPQYDDLAKRLLKTMELSGEVETGLSTTEHNISPVKSKSRLSLDTVPKDNAKKKSRKSMSDTLPAVEEDKMSPPMEPLAKSDDCGKTSVSSPVMESENKMEKHKSAKLDITETMHSSPSKKGDSLGKKKKRKSVSNATPMAEKPEVGNEIEKLIALNKKLLGIVEDDVFREREGDKGDKLASEEKKSKKRKRESKDVTESPQVQ